MSSEILVVLILTALAVLFIFWIRSKSQATNQPERVGDKVNEPGKSNG